jgi:hypothetical protein
MDQSILPAGFTHETRIDPDSAKAGFKREPEVRGIKSQIRCAHCHRWVGWTTYHPRVALAFGSRPIGGMVCTSCHRGLTMFPIFDGNSELQPHKTSPKAVRSVILHGRMPTLDDQEA